MPEDLAAGDDAAVTGRTGLLIIRAWIEPGSSEPLRAHLRVASDVAAGFDREFTLSQPHAVCTTVTEWLEALTRRTEQLT